MIKCWGSVGFINIGVIGVSDRIWGLNVYRYCFKYYINFNYFKFIYSKICWSFLLNDFWCYIIKKYDYDINFKILKWKIKLLINDFEDYNKFWNLNRFILF